MLIPGRNDPCPCASGKKFKKCCAGRDAREVAALVTRRAAAIQEAQRVRDQTELAALQGRVAEIRGLIEANKNFAHRVPLRPEIEAHVRQVISDEKFADASATQLMAFIEPMIDMAGADPSKLAMAVKTGIVLWSVVTIRDAEARDRALEAIQEKMGMRDAQQIIEFRLVSSKLRKRHKFLFPEIWAELHEARIHTSTNQER